MKNWPLLLLISGFAKTSFAAEKTGDIKTEDAFLSSLATSYDFSETQINGEKKEPFGDLLQGNQKQKLNELIQIEPDIGQEMMKAKTAVKLLN